MIIGIPKEIKKQENRVAATPAMARALAEAGHRVRVQSQAGVAIGYADEMYEPWAEVVFSAEEVYACEMVLKVKEPQLEEFPLLREGQILFCYLHLAPDPLQTKRLVESRCVAIAYETVTDPQGRLPLLAPMSEIAGRIAIQAGATALQMNHGGKGVLLGGAPGVLPANVVVIGGGAVGAEATRMALGLGANVTVIEKNLNRLRELDALYGPRLNTLFSNTANIEEAVSRADLVVGAVLIPGKKAPRLITREILRRMSRGSVIVDVAIDQGGCAETSRPTTHDAPTYIEEGVVHYCVANMPGACARTSTQALTNATLDYALQIANKGYRQALLDNKGLQDGLNVYFGQITNECVADDLGYAYTPATEALKR